MDTISQNRRAWNERVQGGQNRWTQPVTPAQVEDARRGVWSIFLTPSPVPKAWLGDVAGKDVLCLASGGGQQGPILAAAGANVTVFDLSDAQLGQDRFVAEREGLNLKTVQGDMRDLSAFEDAAFDLVVHPVSNCFVPDVRPVWHEAYRVLRPGGQLLAGMVNPLLYALGEEDSLTVQHKVPFSDLEHLSESEQKGRFESERALEFGHSLQDLIGGQCEAGFVPTGFYEDRFAGKAVDAYLPVLFATRALKP
jgi:SAM-dependent methyltransferase